MTGYTKNKPETIQAMFGSIASQYDRTNAVLSFQMHKNWNQKLVKAVTSQGDPDTFLDLCCGTGEIAFSYLKKSPPATEIYLIDFCKQMLSCAREKGNSPEFQNYPITYIQADVQDIPLDNQSIVCATMAYGIRNVQNPKKCFDEVLRVLKPGGCFAILELTQPTNPFLSFGHKFYLRMILPILGKILTSNQEAYRYLCNSIQAFIKPHELSDLLSKAGFTDISIEPLSGGIATIIMGRKPS